MVGSPFPMRTHSPKRAAVCGLPASDCSTQERAISPAGEERDMLKLLPRDWLGDKGAEVAAETTRRDGIAQGIATNGVTVNATAGRGREMQAVMRW